ncbi:hypothetical protein SUGI_1044390 [Cryptomeria japonica]|uniref:uncharacterized protein LOC131034119 n=1 Tax=Cryptomeria japonica TaxID=3369 RepID=UPI002414CFFA|nr:uncharacterized protein LOC131034119 [Cryptomeria japonica]GLJ49368.1 hypothetical protein SUGI_1044390 [Cryptomeria japonica]
MKKGIHPAKQWITMVMPSGRILRMLATKFTSTPKVYHLKSRRQISETIGQIAKFRRRYGGGVEEEEDTQTPVPPN